MKPVFLLLALVLVSAGGASAAPKSGGPLRPLPANPRYFTDNSGRAIFLTGSHTWANFATDQGTTPFDYEGYLDFLGAHHHNFFRAWVWDLTHSKQGFNGGPFDWAPAAWERTGPGQATDGRPKFDLTKFNQAFFDRVRARVILARERGCYVSIMLFQGFAWQYNREAADGFPYDGRNNLNGVDGGPKDGAATLDHPAVTAMQEAYVRKIIDTVNDLDNVMYEISNESGPQSTAWQYHFIDFVHQYERTKPYQHPVGMTYQYEGGKNEDLYASPADWISPDCTAAFRESPPVADGGKVIVFDTDHGYGWKILKADGPAQQRVWAWKCFLRGNHTLFMDPYLAKIATQEAVRNAPAGTNPHDPYFGLTPDPYYESLRAALGDTRRFAEKLDLVRMTPRNELASTTYCLADPGREYAVYSPPGETAFTVRLAAGTYAFEWFDPVAGVAGESGQVTTPGGSHAFAAPFTGGAVLHLKSAD